MKFAGVIAMMAIGAGGFVIYFLKGNEAYIYAMISCIFGLGIILIDKYGNNK